MEQHYYLVKHTCKNCGNQIEMARTFDAPSPQTIPFCSNCFNYTPEKFGLKPEICLQRYLLHTNNPWPQSNPIWNPKSQVLKTDKQNDKAIPDPKPSPFQPEIWKADPILKEFMNILSQFEYQPTAKCLDNKKKELKAHSPKHFNTARTYIEHLFLKALIKLTPETPTTPEPPPPDIIA